MSFAGSGQGDQAGTSRHSGSESLSQLVARILDQLSVSAWLPAATLVAMIVVGVQLREADGDISNALRSLGAIGLSSVLLLVGAVIVATVLTQAFQFEAIRHLEGYWGHGRIRVRIADRLAKRHLARRKRLELRQRSATMRAFPPARQSMITAGISQPVVDALELLVTRGSAPNARDEDRRQASVLDWLNFAPLRDRREIAELGTALENYPRADALVQPTVFGNTLRAYEELVHSLGYDALEHLIQASFHELPTPVQIEHDQFRARLDLYCTLTPTFLVGGAVVALLVAETGPLAPASVVVVSLACCWLSYRAAVTSARAYGGVLVTIAENWLTPAR
jgi:hypothetical protein